MSDVTPSSRASLPPLRGMFSQRRGMNKKLPAEPPSSPALERRRSSESVRDAAILSAQVVTLGRGNFARAARFRHGSGGVRTLPAGLELGGGVVPETAASYEQDPGQAPRSPSCKTSAPSVVTRTSVQAAPTAARPRSRDSIGSLEEFRSVLAYLSPETSASPPPTSHKKILGPAIPLRKSTSSLSAGADPVTPRKLHDFKWPAQASNPPPHVTEATLSPKSGGKQADMHGLGMLREEHEPTRHAKTDSSASSSSRDSWGDRLRHLSSNDLEHRAEYASRLFRTRMSDSERSNSTADTSTDTHDYPADKRHADDRARQLSEPAHRRLSDIREADAAAYRPDPPRRAVGSLPDVFSPTSPVPSAPFAAYDAPSTRKSKPAALKLSTSFTHPAGGNSSQRSAASPKSARAAPPPWAPPPSEPLPPVPPTPALVLKSPRPPAEPRRSADFARKPHPLIASRARTASAPFIKGRKKSDAPSVKELPRRPSVLTPAEADDFFDSIQAALEARSELPLDKLQVLHAPPNPPEVRAAVESDTRADAALATQQSHASSLVDPLVVPSVVVVDEPPAETSVGSAREEPAVQRSDSRFPTAVGEVAQAFRQLQAEKAALEQLVRPAPAHELSAYLAGLHTRLAQKGAEVENLLGVLETQKEVMEQLLATHALEVGAYADENARLQAEVQRAGAQDAEIARLRLALADALADSAPAAPATGDASLLAQIAEHRQREAQIRTAYHHVRAELRKHTPDQPAQLKRLSLPLVALAPTRTPLTYRPDTLSN